MKMSNIGAVKIALVPGAAESLGKSTNGLSCLDWYAKTKDLKRARNALYVSAAFTAIAVLGGLSNKNSSAKCVHVITAILGTGLVVFNANKLYNATLFVQRIINLGTRSKRTEDC